MRSLSLVVLGLVGLACSDGNESAATTTTLPAPTTTRVRGPEEPPDPCTLLTSADFAAVGVTLEAPGVDLSDQLSLATDASSACHWMGGGEGELRGNWELLIGKGHAKEAFEFDYGFAALDGVEDLDIGDDAFLSDRVDSATPEDYDFETGVLLGDLYVTLGSTEDDGRDATIELTRVIAERLASSR